MFLKAGPSGQDVIASCSKGGINYAFGLGDVNSGPTALTLLSRVLGGNTGILGGANFTAAGDTRRLIANQTNAGETTSSNTAYQTSNDPKSLVPQAKQVGPQLAWYPVTQSFPDIVAFEYGTSYMSAFDVNTGTVTYEVATTPQDPTITSLGGGPAIGKGAFFMSDGSGRMQVFNSVTGAHLGAFDLQSGGVTTPLVENDKIYVLSGRAFTGVSFPASNYAATNEMFVFGLNKPKCHKSYYCC